jgi:hypothetical protein
MRKEYGKELRTLFPKRLREVAPEFEPARVSSTYLFAGERAFRWVPFEPVHCWIILSPSAKGHQAFTVEVGWSVYARFPELGMRPTPLPSLDAATAYPREECVVRVKELRTDQDQFWHLPDPAVENPGDMQALIRSLEPLPADDARAAVAPLVEEAISATVEHGLPYLKRFVEWYSSHGAGPGE